MNFLVEPSGAMDSLRWCFSDCDCKKGTYSTCPCKGSGNVNNNPGTGR